MGWEGLNGGGDREKRTFEGSIWKLTTIDVFKNVYTYKNNLSRVAI